MTVTRHQRNSETSGQQRPSTEFSERSRLLKTHQALFGKDLSDDEARVWLGVMRDFSIIELRYAFDNWARNGKFFPKPKDIIELCDAFRLSHPSNFGYPNCDDLCKSRHWRGYGENDVKWLLRRYFEERKKPQPMTAEQLLEELDSKREGGAPEWRRA